MNVNIKSYDTSTLEGKSSSVVLASPKVPILQRKQFESRQHLSRTEPSPAQRALIELKSLHGQKNQIQYPKLENSFAGNKIKIQLSSSQSKPGRRSNKTNSNLPLMPDITNPRNLYQNDTVKHLMHQLTELNNLTYDSSVENRDGSESFCSEITLKSRLGGDHSGSGKRNQKSGKMNQLSFKSKSRQSSHHVMKLIERQILKDLSHKLNNSGEKREQQEDAKDSSRTKTHSEELPGGMKVVITKTTRPEEAKSNTNHRKEQSKSKHNFPSINITSSEHKSRSTQMRRKSEQYEWSVENPTQTKSQFLPSMNGVKVNGYPTKSNADGVVIAPSSRQQTSYTSSHHGERPHNSLPKIQEEPDTIVQTQANRESNVKTKDVGTNCSPDISIPSSNTSPEYTKVKLPILGKSFGQQRELNYEGSSKFTKPSLREIKRIIHGLYGDYFDSTLERYYTYEKQLNETKNMKPETDTPLHYVTPAWDDTTTPESHTLRLFNSGSKRSEDSTNAKQQSKKISVPLLRSKYGKAVASSNKSAERRLERRYHGSRGDARMTYSQPIMRSTRQALGEVNSNQQIESRAYLPSITPNTPEREHELRHYIAHQVALYHEQIARENRSLGLNSSRDDKHLSKYIIEEKEGKEMLAQFSNDIDKYAQHILNLESYLEAKRQHSLARKAKLREIKKKQKEKKEKQKNKYLEVVEQRDTFLAQVSNNQRESEIPNTPRNSENANERDVTFEYIHDDHRYQETPITKMIDAEKETSGPEVSQSKQPMETKIYRIFGERNKSSGVRRWVAQTPLPFTSRVIKRQVPRSSKGVNKTLVLQQPRPARQKVPYKPRLMTDLVSRFQVTTRYKLDKDYVASLAYGTS